MPGWYKGGESDRKESNNHIINGMKRNQTYTSPEVDILDVAVEDVVCQSPTGFKGNEIEDAIFEQFPTF